jgi:hypothetical protein
LRQAVTQSATDDTVLFDVGASTVTLTQGAITIDHSLTIYAPPQYPLTISGNHNDRIFTVNNAPVVILESLNLTQGRVSGCGGALYVKNSYVSMSGGGVSASSADRGGGVCLVDAGASAYLQQSRVVGNSAGLGGGIYALNADLFGIQDTTVSGNTAGRAGGGLYAVNVASFLITTSVIRGNTVPAPTQYSYSSEGGGVVIAGTGSSSFYASTLAGNHAYASGSAIRIQNSAAANKTTFSRVTIAGNVSATGGGAVSSNGGAPQFAISIVANNAGGDLDGTFVANYSLIKSTSGAQLSGDHNFLGVDPLLGPLGDHGGPTFCMVPASNSPVIDAGGPNSANTADQRGYPVNNYYDIGAVERQFPEDIVFRDRFDSY